MRLFLIFLIFLVGCSVKKPFKDEDKYIMKALVYESSGDYLDAAKVYKFLYKKTENKIYFRKYIQMLFSLKKYNELIKEADNFLNKNFDKVVFEYKIFSLIKLGKLKEAKKELLEKFNKKDEFFYSIMSFILAKEKNYKEALIYSKSLYALKPTKRNLLNLVDNLIKMKKYNEALAYLQTHIRIHKCDYEICIRLAEIYKELYDIDNLASIYEKLGKFDKKYYLLALNLYIDNKEYKKAINLVKKHHLSEEYLMYIYEEMKDYKKAALVSMNLYLKTGDIKYFLKYTLYLYKMAPNDKENVKEVVRNLKEVVKKIKTPFIYNFLGYLLIDYDINPKKGLEYVKKAVELKPDNIDYIDSLAWGYYKIKKCKEAWDIIKDIDTTDKEILKHKKLIKRCLDDFRKNHKSNKKRFRKKKK